MLVDVEIDLARDRDFLEAISTDQAIAASLRIYEATEDETYLERVGRHIWNASSFPELIREFCGEALFSFEQRSALLFAFQTEESSAWLLRLRCHLPLMVTITSPRRQDPGVLWFDPLI
jgi:hypothetical protein